MEASKTEGGHCIGIDPESKGGVFIGIDPGATGAIAAIVEYQGKRKVYISDYSDRAKSLAILWDLQCRDVGYYIALEQVGAMPGQGVTSMFHFGENFGWWKGAVEAIGLMCETVRPRAWMKEMGIPKKADKGDKPGLLVARELFPECADMLARKKDNGRADALLLAEWVRRKHVGVA